jgi:hypothetical protein
MHNPSVGAHRSKTRSVFAPVKLALCEGRQAARMLMRPFIGSTQPLWPKVAAQSSPLVRKNSHKDREEPRLRAYLRPQFKPTRAASHGRDLALSPLEKVSQR